MRLVTVSRDPKMHTSWLDPFSALRAVFMTRLFFMTKTQHHHMQFAKVNTSMKICTTYLSYYRANTFLKANNLTANEVLLTPSHEGKTLLEKTLKAYVEVLESHVGQIICHAISS